MRLRRFRGTILVSVLIAAAFIADGVTDGEPSGAESEDSAALLTRGAGGSGSPGETERGAGSGSPRATPGPETGGSRMGGGSRLGGNSVHGLDTSSAGPSGPGLGDTGRPSIF